MAKLKLLKRIVLRFTTVGAVGLFFALAVFLLPQWVLFPFLLLLLLAALLNHVVESNTFSYHQTASTMVGDYELAKRRWKKEIEENSPLEPDTDSPKPTTRLHPRIIPGSFSSKNSARILRLIHKPNEKESKNLNARIRLRSEINDQILEKRIRSEFLRIQKLKSVEYQKGLREIRKLLNLRRESLIS
jgi:hypothetical protein